eukprot:SAG11_NODE_3872_length_2177_cov_10.191049_1_plen_106_part_00
MQALASEIDRDVEPRGVNCRGLRSVEGLEIRQRGDLPAHRADAAVAEVLGELEAAFAVAQHLVNCLPDAVIAGLELESLARPRHRCLQRPAGARLRHKPRAIPRD